MVGWVGWGGWLGRVDGWGVSAVAGAGGRVGSGGVPPAGRRWMAGPGGGGRSAGVGWGGRITSAGLIRVGGGPGLPAPLQYRHLGPPAPLTGHTATWPGQPANLPLPPQASMPPPPARSQPWVPTTVKAVQPSTRPPIHPPTGTVATTCAEISTGTCTNGRDQCGRSQTWPRWRQQQRQPL